MTTTDAPPDDPAQSQRFIDMAREIAATEDPTAFGLLFDKVRQLPPKTDKPQSPKKS